MSKLPYSMVIVWSEEDDCYLVHLPDFPEQRFRTHGETYEEAAKNGQEVLELLLEDEDFPPLLKALLEASFGNKYYYSLA